MLCSTFDPMLGVEGDMPSMEQFHRIVDAGLLFNADLRVLRVAQTELTHVESRELARQDYPR